MKFNLKEKKGSIGINMLTDHSTSKLNASGAGNEEALSVSEIYWRVRVCPIPFEDFCQLQNLFKMLISSSISLEFRISSVLTSKMPNAWQCSPHDADISWVPRHEKAFRKHQIAATLGMLEVIVSDSLLVRSVHCIRNANFSRKGRFRFELKRLTREEAQACSDNRSTMKTEADTSDNLIVKFSVRLESIYQPAIKHPPGHQKSVEDNYIFVKKIPDEVPDHVLQVIFPTEMVERRTGADNTGTATFNVKSSLGAQVYMEMYDGILVNSNMLELSTNLGTLQDAKKKHYEIQVNQTQANATELKGQTTATDNSDAERGQTRKRTYEMSTFSPFYGRARRTNHPVPVHRETVHPTTARKANHVGARRQIDRGARRAIHPGARGVFHGRARGSLHPPPRGAIHVGARGTFNPGPRGTIHGQPRGTVHSGPREERHTGAMHRGILGRFHRGAKGTVHSRGARRLF